MSPHKHPQIKKYSYFLRIPLFYLWKWNHWPFKVQMQSVWFSHQSGKVNQKSLYWIKNLWWFTLVIKSNYSMSSQRELGFFSFGFFFFLSFWGFFQDTGSIVRLGRKWIIQGGKVNTLLGSPVSNVWIRYDLIWDNKFKIYPVESQAILAEWPPILLYSLIVNNFNVLPTSIPSLKKCLGTVRVDLIFFSLK